MRRGVHRRATMAAAVCVATMAAAPATASAEFLGPDLTAAPDGFYPCGTPPCAIFGLDGPVGPGGPPIPIHAPTNGTITEVQVRVPEGEEIPIELVELELRGANEFFFRDSHPLGETGSEGFGFFGVSIEVPEDTILGVKANGAGNTIGNYGTPGENGVKFFDPSPETGESVDPLDGEQLPEQTPAIRLQFVPEPPLIPGGGSIEPPQLLADVEVTKKFLPGGGLSTRIGDLAEFLVRVRNRGPDAAQGVLLRDTFGRGLVFDQAIVRRGSAGKARCSGSNGKNGGALTCRLGTLAPGATVGISVFFVVNGKRSKDAGPVEKRTEKNVAKVSSASPLDPDLSNNVARAQARIEGGALCPARSKAGTSRGDRLRGSGRPETMLGLSGNDRLDAKRGLDCLFGHGGRDVLIGGTQRDYMDGGDDNDTILAVDGRPDTIVCGPGKRDRVVADRSDNVAPDCERVRRR